MYSISETNTGLSDGFENLDLASLSDAELIDVMQKLNIRFGPINPMTRKIYYKKIKAAKEGDSEHNWHLLQFRALMIVGVFSLTLYYFKSIKIFSVFVGSGI